MIKGQMEMDSSRKRAGHHGELGSMGRGRRAAAGIEVRQRLCDDCVAVIEVERSDDVRAADPEGGLPRDRGAQPVRSPEESGGQRAQVLAQPRAQLALEVHPLEISAPCRLCTPRGEERGFEHGADAHDLGVFRPVIHRVERPVVPAPLHAHRSLLPSKRRLQVLADLPALAGRAGGEEPREQDCTLAPKLLAEANAPLLPPRGGEGEVPPRQGLQHGDDRA